MSEIYLNSSMLQELNLFVQDYVTKTLLSRAESQQNQRLIATTTLFATLFLFYVSYKLLFTSSLKVKPINFTLEIPDAAKNNWKSKRLVNTEIIDPSQPNIIQSHCPATGQHLSSYLPKYNEDIDEMVTIAQNAQEEWAKADLDRRLKVLHTLHEYIINNQEIIARVTCRDTGKTMLDASLGEIMATIDKLNWIIRYGPKHLQPSARSGTTNYFMEWYRGTEVHYEPLGVVSSIISWNYPFYNVISPIISAIFTGNAIIVKCSEQVIWSSEFFISIVRKCLEVCNEDPDLVQLCYCLPKSDKYNATNYFISHPGFKHITFIGRKTVANKILNCAAESLTPVVVELCGKDSYIVLESQKDVSSVSSLILRTTFQSSGQSCIGIERIIVSSKRYKQTVQLLKDRLTTQPLRLGSDMDHLENIDVGAMISPKTFDSLEELIKDAVESGATLICGGSRYNHPNYPQGHYFQPTLLVDVTSDMKIANSDLFGPILLVMKANSDEDCITIANAAPYAVGTCVFGKNVKQCRYVAKKLKTTDVTINDFTTFYVRQTPFGGISGSGSGKFGSKEGLLSLCYTKSISFNIIPHIPTPIPSLLDYPIKNNNKAWAFIDSFITGAYTFSSWKRVKSVFSMAKNSK
ncbi:hypothetical protein Kpol_1023p51 [Vanderwaltozyma polyspora DSM 70294]|uniref:Aldehyde dehydrogenase domain-containing protein n=1 Tax=Vanderwaltozyma polyspora (strain ATCC 22028 / DSM 70294 / BCRC 21397 / CBS 2163 / NBRC 10782 / NRRL Y-8283 / UCD 57-17) TaxID=436907 RepID=A7TFS4_VANPO|nr:uncharacterized protein Kpol_1023p51 [Vanderwaltozyma polyspora DSM 70294]EDO18882.1 hypothetical protein Kpol_1023p51 [Vanderwaltozyma polyspora DSM 70294]